MKEKCIFKDRTGERYTTNEGYEVTIVEYFGVNNCTIQFEDGCKDYHKTISNLTSGKIKNKNHPSVLGIGFIGYGKYKSRENGLKIKYYHSWTSIFKRCYSKKEQDKFPRYKECFIETLWYNFQNFAEWFEDNYDINVVKDWHLDKDILVKGNKIYSSETCCFVPQEINMLFTKNNIVRGKYPIGVSLHPKGKFQSSINREEKIRYLGLFNTPEEAFQAYKTAKEAYIKEVADKWKDKIEPRVYTAMYNYQVEITD